VTSPTELDFTGVEKVVVFLMRGSVQVVGADTETARVNVTESAHGPLTVSTKDGTLEVTHAPKTPAQIAGQVKDGEHRSHAVVTVTVPAGATVDVTTIYASGTVTDLTGPVKVFCGESRTSLARLAGHVEVTNFNGRVDALDLAGAVKITAYTASVALAGVTGSVRAETLSGDLTVDARPKAGSHLHLSSDSGPVVAGLPSLTDTRVELASAAGRVRSDFPDLSVRDVQDAKVADGVFGTPLRELWVRTETGDVTLLRRG
jgi:hypothetical protein